MHLIQFLLILAHELVFGDKNAAEKCANQFKHRDILSEEYGADIIDHCIVPVECLGENASETRKNHYNMDQRFHARNNCRLNNKAGRF